VRLPGNDLLGAGNRALRRSTGIFDIADRLVARDEAARRQTIGLHDGGRLFQIRNRLFEPAH
jgi:hypothetical protein